MKTTTLAILVAIMLSGCGGATRYRGSANFPGGARGCFTRCAGQDMEMEGFVYMGEYSSACVCRLKHAQGSASASSGALAAAVGVVIQQRADDAAMMSAALGGGALGGLLGSLITDSH